MQNVSVLECVQDLYFTHRLFYYIRTFVCLIKNDLELLKFLKFTVHINILHSS